MNRTVIISLVLFIVVGGLIIWKLNSDNATDIELAINNQQTSVQQESEDQNSTPINNAQETESTVLEAVGSYSGKGTATRTVDGKFVHEVIAMIGEPAPGDFYEGWLVGGPEGFISTGKLDQEAPGEWSLVFTSDQDMSAYNNIVITEETEADGLDGIPEDHVLEGSF